MRKILRSLKRILIFLVSGPYIILSLTKMTSVEYPVRTVMRPTKRATEIRVRAAACHASQGGGQRHRGPLLFRINAMLSRQQDYFTRGYPPPTRHLEQDLFEGLTE